MSGDSKMSKIHSAPKDEEGVTPCCGRSPFDLPLTDRLTNIRSLVTCHSEAVRYQNNNLDGLLEWLKEDTEENGAFVTGTGTHPRQETLSEEVLKTAKNIVGGFRQSGIRERNFGEIAKVWNVILSSKLKMAGSIDAHDIALCMVGLKLIREVDHAKVDNCVDGAGYFALAAEEAEKERKEHGVF